MKNKNILTLVLFLIIVTFNIKEALSTKVIPLSSQSNSSHLPASVKSTFNGIEDGIIVCWFDDVNNGSLFAQKTDLNGKIKWMDKGVLLDSDLGTGFTSESDYPQIFSNDLGGAVIIYRKVFLNSHEIFVLRFNTDGLTSRMPISLSEYYDGFNFSPRAILSNNQTITVVWENFSWGDFNIHAQKIDFGCNKLWNEGIEVEVCDDLYDQRKPTIAIDEDNYIFVTWLDARNISEHEFSYDLYANRLDSNGNYLDYGSSGRLIFSPYGYSSQELATKKFTNDLYNYDPIHNMKKEFLYNHNIVASDKNSVVVAVEGWMDFHISFIKVFEVNQTLEITWEKIISDNLNRTNPLITTNEEKDILLLWLDRRNQSEEVFGMMLDKSGVVLWGGESGTRVSRDNVRISLKKILSSDKIQNPVFFDRENISFTWVTSESTKLFFSNINLVTDSHNFDRLFTIQGDIADGQYTSIVKCDKYFSVVYMKANDIFEAIIPTETFDNINTPENIQISNFPNPFNPVTQINFSILKDGIVKLDVYDLAGRTISTLINEFKTAGNYSTKFDGSSLSSGVYFYRLESNGFVQTKKMTLIK